MIGAQADGHYDVTAFRHLSNPIQHLRRSARCRDHYHLWFRSIDEGVFRYDFHSARDTDRLSTVRHSIKLKEFHVLHAHRARGGAKGELEGFPGADKINRLSPSPYDEGDRYLAVGWWNQFRGRPRRRARRLLARESCSSKVQDRKKTGGDGRTCTSPYETPARQSFIHHLFLVCHAILLSSVKFPLNESVKQRQSPPSAYCFTQIEVPSLDLCARLDALECNRQIIRPALAPQRCPRRSMDPLHSHQTAGSSLPGSAPMRHSVLGRLPWQLIPFLVQSTFSERHYPARPAPCGRLSHVCAVQPHRRSHHRRQPRPALKREMRKLLAAAD